MPKRSKIPRDPAAPQKPSSAFFFFLKEQQWVVRAEMRKAAPDQASVSNNIVAKECGRRWRLLDENTKSKYVEQHQLAKNVYNEKFRDYLAEKERKEAGDNKSKSSQEQPIVASIPKTHEDYFNFCGTNWRKTSMSMPGLSPLDVQNRLWQLWLLQPEEEDRPQQNPVQFCEVNLGPEEEPHVEEQGAVVETDSSKSSFDFFVMSIFQNTKSTVSEEKLLKLCEEKWKYMNDEEKETFVEMEAQEKERLRTERMTAVRAREEDEGSLVELSDEEIAELTMQAHDYSGDDLD